MSNVVRIDPGPRMSEASVFGDRMYLSGMIPEDTSLDVTGQVKQALAEIDSLLKKGGSDKTKILSAVIWARGTARRPLGGHRAVGGFAHRHREALRVGL